MDPDPTKTCKSINVVCSIGKCRAGCFTPPRQQLNRKIGTMMKIDIYYSSVCGLCTKAIEFFRSRNLTFTAYSVEWDAINDKFVDSENSSEMYERCKEEVDFVPQIFIGNVHIKGWKKLEPMIKSGEFDTLLEKEKY